MESNTTRIISCDSTSSEGSTLLMLNEYCLMDIFAFLKTFDFANLARTCKRLYSVALDVDDKFEAKFKEIEFSVLKNSQEKVTRSNEQFSDVLSVYGGHVESVNIMFGESNFVFETIHQNCQKLNRLELGSLCSVKELPSQQFSNLRELKIRGYDQIDINEFRKFFTSNPNIESLEVYALRFSGFDNYRNIFISKFFEYLELLTKLKLLKLDYSYSQSDGFEPDYRRHILKNLLNLTRLTDLTKLSLIGFRIDDSFLEQLASKSNLLELVVPQYNHYRHHVQLNELFPNLEALDMNNCNIRTIFPPKLRLLGLSGAWMPCNRIIAIVKQLKLLEEFVVNVDEFWTNQRYDWLSRIVDEIGERDLTIIYQDSDGVAERYLYNSNHLQIIRNRFWPLKTARPVRLPNVYIPL